ncbi:MAG: hypothetical protein PCFJNLEI_03905 [Verrucomicrobiae bacterium]|nr:hypothetical protein [Verrucomicrobiae bacterium]
MNVTQVQFRIVGDDDRIPNLGGLLDGGVDGAIKKGQPQVGRESPHHFISIRLSVGDAEQKTANEKVTEWLCRHQSLLAGLDGDKWVEFSTALLPEQAYETLAFSQELLRAAVDAKCRLHNTCYAVWPRHDSMWKRHVGA